MRCRICREEKDFREFAFRDKKWNIRYKVCRACQSKPTISPALNEDGGSRCLPMTSSAVNAECQGEVKDL